MNYRFHHITRTSRIPEAFTLIELLVVIAIISLLVSILVPSLQKAKDLAKMSVCSSNLRNLCLSDMTYANDWNGYIVPFNRGAPGWEELYYFYTNVLVNGGYVPEVKAWRDQSWGNVIEGVWRCPSVDDDHVEWGGGYGVSGGEWPIAAHIVGIGFSQSLEQLTRSSELWMFGDTEGNWNSTGKTFRTTKLYSDCALHLDWETDYASPLKCAAPRHVNSTTMVGYIDGHIGTVSWDDVRLNENDLFGHFSK